MKTLAQMAFDSLECKTKWDNLTEEEQNGYNRFCDKVRAIMVEEIAKLADAQNSYTKQDAVNLAAEMVEKMQ